MLKSHYIIILRPIRHAIRQAHGPECIEGLMALSIVEGLTGGSSVFKDSLDSGSSLPRTRYGVRNDAERTYS